MSKLGGLIINEHVKLYQKLGTWIIFAINFVFLLLITYTYEPWKKEIADGYLDIITSQFILVLIFAITVGASLIISEYTGGTIKLLLIRPIHRWKVLMAKWITLQLFVIYQMVAISLLTMLILVLSGLNDFSIKIGDVHISWFLFIVLEYVEILVFSTLSFTIAVVFRNQGLAFGVSIFTYFVGGIFSMLMSEYGWFDYTLFANTNLTDNYIVSFVKQPYDLWMDTTVDFKISFFVLMVHLIGFLVTSFLFFEKRDVTE